MKKKLKKFLKILPVVGALALGSGTAKAGWEDQGYINTQTGDIVQEIPVKSYLTKSDIENNFSTYFNVNEVKSFVDTNGLTKYRYQLISNNRGTMAEFTIPKPMTIDEFQEFLKTNYDTYYNGNILSTELDLQNSPIARENMKIRSLYEENIVFNYTGSLEDNKTIFDNAIGIGDNINDYGDFKLKIKELIGNEQDPNKIRSFLKFTYDKLYSKYDNDVKFGHSEIISLERYYEQAIINGNDIGNCGDISCILLDMSKDIFNIGGVVMHSGIHLGAVFEMDDGLYNPEIKKVSKNLYELIDAQVFPTVTSLFSTCSDTLIGEVQTFFQKDFEQNISPSGKTNYLDYFDNSEIEQFEAKGFHFYILGNSEKNITTLKYNLGNVDYGNKIISGDFDTAFSFSHQENSLYDSIDLVSASFNNNLSHQLDDEGKFVIGNFTKGLISSAIGGDVGVGYDNLSIIGHDFQLRNKTYVLYKNDSGLYLGLSLGQIFQTKTVNKNQELSAHKITEFNVGYTIKGVKLDYVNKKLGVTTNHEFQIKSSVGNHSFGVAALKTDSDNKFIDKYASDIQSRLEYSLKKWGFNTSVSYDTNGSDGKIMIGISGKL